MAWTYYNGISATQETTYALPNYAQPWATSRSMRGRVEMRLTDVTITKASEFWVKPWVWQNPATLTVWLLNVNGSVISGPYSVTKNWGVVGGWTYVGFVSPARGVRLQTKISLNTNGVPNYEASWKADIRFDGTGL
ncbi:hypothetical protein [Microbacterium sp. LWH10-1.2]|uniref:hypothetical protein n=1 Tax=Microbacterium sp. LWH10-1.2 TaxID=3135255 RepID=UPI00313A1DD3